MRKAFTTSRASKLKRKRRHQEILAAWNKLRSQATHETRSFFSDVEVKMLAPMALVGVLAVVSLSMLMACRFSGECKRPHMLYQLTGHLGHLRGLQATPTCLFGPYASCELPKSAGDWGEWSKCNVNCGDGNRTRIRTDPSVATGIVVQIGPCSAPIVCASSKVYAWSQWLQWERCTKTCGPFGQQDRSRKCMAEKESEVAHPSNCPGMSGERRQCNMDVKCPEIYFWGLWTPWGPCSKTCDQNSTKTRTRMCVSETSVHDKQSNCKGDGLESVECNKGIDCLTFREIYFWSLWTPWGPCSKTCDQKSTKTRTRTCMSVTSVDDKQRNCKGDGLESVECNKGINCF